MPLAPRSSRLAAHIFIIAALDGGASLELLAEECQAFGAKYKSAQDIMQAVLSELETIQEKETASRSSALEAADLVGAMTLDPDQDEKGEQETGEQISFATEWKALLPTLMGPEDVVNPI